MESGSVVDAAMETMTGALPDGMVEGCKMSGFAFLLTFGTGDLDSGLVWGSLSVGRCCRDEKAPEFEMQSSGHGPHPRPTAHGPSAGLVLLPLSLGPAACLGERLEQKTGR